VRLLVVRSCRLGLPSETQHSPSLSPTGVCWVALRLTQPTGYDDFEWRLLFGVRSLFGD
jgi:hypothetical protein